LVRYPASGLNSKRVRYVVRANGVDTVFFINQQLMGGQWITLGEYHARDINTGQVRLSVRVENLNSVGRVVADAASFCRVEV